MAPEWVERLREANYTSPSGIVSTPKVDVLSRSGGKKASVHEILNKSVAILQDQGNKVIQYQMDMYFTGTNGDQEADNFYKSLREQYTTQSPGKLKHPRWGDLDVIPFEFTQTEQLTTGAGVFRVPVTFYEIPNTVYPVPEGIDPSQITANIDALKEIANEANEGIKLESPSAIAKFAADISMLVAEIDSIIGDIVTTYETVSDAYTLIKNDILAQIDSTQAEITANATQIMAQTNAMINIGAGVMTSTLDKSQAFLNTVQGLVLLFQNDSGNEVEQVNSALIYQSAGTIATVSTAEAALSTEYETRDMAGSAIDFVNDANDDILSGLDSIITSLGNNFAPDHDTWSMMATIIGQTNSTLIDRSFDLKAKQSYRLRNASDPITETYKYYKDLEQLEFFIRTNKLANDEIIEIPSGRELVVYV